MDDNDDNDEVYDDFDDTRPMKSPRTGEIVWPPKEDAQAGLDTREIVMRSSEVSQEVKVLTPEQAADIRFDYEPTVMEENRFNFVGEVGETGEITIPERFRKPGGLIPGTKIIVSVTRVGDGD